VQQSQWCGDRGVLHLDLRRPDAANRRQGRAVEKKAGQASDEAVASGNIWVAEDGAHGDAPPHRADYRSDLKAARTSSENSSGSSQAAKWPPVSTSLK
jgi:hypothetical protein